MNILERKKRWNDFYRLDDKQTKILFAINYSHPVHPKSPKLWPEKKQERIDWGYEMWQLEMERSTWLDDDFIPYLHVAAGTEVFAEAFGCKAIRPERGYNGALPMVFNAEEAAKIKVPRLEDTPLMMLFEIAEGMKARAGKDAVLRFPVMMCPLDLAAQLWDKTDLYYSILEEPEAVKEVVNKAREILIAFMDEWIRRFGSELIGHHPHYYMNGGVPMTIDEIGAFSSDLYKEFVEEDMRIFSERYGGMGVHCCADARHQWENLARIPGLRLLNLTRPEKTLWEAYDYFKNIAAMWPEKMEKGIPEALPNPKKSDLPTGAHLILTENARTRDDALRIAEALHKEYR